MLIPDFGVPGLHTIVTINLNRKAKTPHLEGNLVIIKDPKKGRVCVSVNSIIQGVKRSRHTHL